MHKLHFDNGKDGPLLDAWDELNNDTKGVLKEDAPTLCEYLDKLEEAMCADILDEE